MTAGVATGRSPGSVAYEPPGWASAFARMAAAAAIAIAAVVLLGWLIDAHVLRAFSTGAVAMKTNAAVGVVMAGVAVLLKVGAPPRRRRLTGDGLGLACIVLGLVTLAEYATGWQPGIDELLFSEALTAVRTSSPNRMAASAALCLILLGAAVVLMGRGLRRTAVAQCLAGVVGVLGVLALAGYGFGSSLLYQWRRSTAAAIPAGIAFLLLGSAVVVAGRGPPLSVLTSRGPGGMLARRLLPLIVVIPLGVGLLLHVGGEQGWADAGLQTALAALVTIVLLASLTLAIGLRLDRVDAARAAATAELQAVNAGLEREVQARTAALRDSEELFRGAAESMFDPFAIMVAVRDETGTIIDFEYQFANASAAGYLDPDDVAGRGLLELFPFHRDIGLFDAYVRLVDTGEPLTWESWWATLPGENQPRAFDTRATRFGDSVTYTWRDVTARERLSAALQAKTTDLERSNRDLEQFAYVASHDLQEPLRMVSSYTSLLAEDLGDRLDDNTRRHLDYAHDGAERMHQLVHDLLRLLAGGPSRHEPSAGRLRSARRDGHGGPPRSDPRRGGDGDPRSVADGDGGTDRAPAVAHEPCRQRRQVPRRRTGPRARQRRPRRPDVAVFRRGQRYRHRPRQGRADLRGVQTAPSAGQLPGHRHRPGDLQEGRRTPRRAHLGRVATRYRRHVPVHPASGRQRPGGSMNALGGDPIEILLVEDNPGDVELFRRGLGAGKVSNRLTVAEYGADALAHLRGDLGETGRRPQLIVLDLDLPDMSGLDILAALKADPGLRRIPVVVMTGSAAETDIVRSYDLQASGYLTKPFDPRDFVRVVLGVEDYWLSLVHLPPT